MSFHKSSPRGFSLIEILISIFVLSIVLFAVTNVIVTVIRTNRANMDHLIAVNLAEEGLEAVRNMRDTYWEQALPWKGDPAVNIFGSDLHGGEFSLERVDVSVVDAPVGKDSKEVRLQKVFAASPWRLVPKVTTDASGTQGFSLPMGFSRTIKIAFELDSDLAVPTTESAVTSEKMVVTSTVRWKDGSQEKNVSLSTFLTNWKYAQ